MPRWRFTADTRFPAAALVDGHWWVLRINGFPDHPLWTLFVDGRVCGDLWATPPHWELPRPGDPPPPADADVRAAVAPVRHLRAYGSEVGRPCDDPVCCE
ncbi:MAG TPA: hypothetical protein VGN37_16980 [Actinocatenispora sp.]